MKANTSSSVLGGANTLWLVPTLIKPDTTGRQRATASPPPRAETSHSRASWCRGAAPRCAATRTLTSGSSTSAELFERQAVVEQPLHDSVAGEVDPGQ